MKQACYNDEHGNGYAYLQRDCHPAYFFLCAATAFIERRKAVQKARESPAPTPSQGTPDAVPGKAVGQLVTQNGRRLTEPEFLAWVQVSFLQMCRRMYQAALSLVRLP